MQKSKCLFSSPSFPIPLHFPCEKEVRHLEEIKPFGRLRSTFYTHIYASSPKTIISYYAFLRNYNVTNVARLAMGILFGSFEKNYRNWLFVCILLYIFNRRKEKLQQLNVKIENGPFKSAQSHFNPTNALNSTGISKQRYQHFSKHIIIDSFVIKIIKYIFYEVLAFK